MLYFTVILHIDHAFFIEHPIEVQKPDLLGNSIPFMCFQFVLTSDRFTYKISNYQYLYTCFLKISDEQIIKSERFSSN